LTLGSVEGESVRFGKAQLTLVDALLAELPEASCDDQVAAAREKLRAFEGIKPRKEPGGFRGELRPYQRDGLGWLHFLGEFGLGGCLADDMGLGKTVQVLAHLVEQRAAGKGKEGAWLVVAPKSLVFNWAREADRFAPGLMIVAHAGPERSKRAQDLASANLVLTTYATMRMDIELLRTVEFACVVLDEAQAIKNPTSQAAKAARLLRGRRRLALTGTPVENRLEDLWSIFEFLNPGMLGSSAAFRDASRAGSGAESAPGMEALRRALKPFLLRRTKAKVAPELPARSEQTVRCELEGKQKLLYDSLRKHYREQLLGRVERDGMGKSKMHVLEALLRLRQAACHPALVEPKNTGAESAKVATLVGMLEELGQEGHRSLVFSQFTSLLALVRKELDARKIAYEELDGSTSAKERAARVDRFQSGAGAPVFLISLKAGGVGLNLTAAGYVFLLDPWWNPAVEAQAIDRTHRIGQNKNVMAYRLIATGTVEERILELQQSKRELAEAIVSENEGPLASLSRDDLEWLLS
jgi:SNF2 family DNA or RNA helicase